MDNYFNLDTLQKTMEEPLAKRVLLIYNLLNPIQAIDNKYEPEILQLHQEYTSSFIEKLKQVNSWDTYIQFINNEMIQEEQTRLKICKIMHPSSRKAKGLTPYLDAQIENISNLWGTALSYLFQSEYTLVQIKDKMISDEDLTIGEQSNLSQLNNFTEQFYLGCEWAIADNIKVADSISNSIPNSSVSFESFIHDNGFDFIRYPLVHQDKKDVFLSYLNYCSNILSEEYNISKNKLGFNQNGLELCTTNSPAYYMPTTKCISLRLDMINAFFHEHFHALDHQILLGIDLKQVEAMFNRGSIDYSLASEINIFNPASITDSAAKNILLEFNSVSKNLISQRNEKNEITNYTTEEQDQRKKKILTMTQRFLEEIYSKLELDPTPFTPVIQDIIKDFSSISKTIEFEYAMDEKLSTLVNEKFQNKHKNYYVEMTQRIHKLYNNMNEKTLFYNFSLISDNGKPSYFATIPEMLARTAESYFFTKYPNTNITPPEWWENNSYLFYPQDEEKKMIYDQFQNIVKSIKENSTAFEANLGKKNVKKSYQL